MVIPAAVRDEIVAHARAGLPNEACGILAGADGSLIYADGKQIAIPTPKPKAIVDPTGCGDAYRAGLLHGIQQGWDWETTGRLASLMGSLKIASRGGQNHKYTRAELANLYKQHFGSRITL